MRPYTPMGSPYGNPYGFPTNTAPIPTMTPGAPYTPGGTYAPGGGIPTYPDSNLGQPTPITPNSTYTPSSGTGSGTDAPFYSPGSASKSPYEGGGVPKYNDAGMDGNFQMPHPSNTADGTNVNEYGSIEGAAAEVASVAKVSLDNAHFEQPLVVQRTAAPCDAPPTAFAHDADHFHWVRGVLQRDQSSGLWSVLYSTNPNAADPYQGRLTLQPHPRFEELAPQSVVTVHGVVDMSTPDAQGRPTYRVESVNLFDPNPIP